MIIRRENFGGILYDETTGDVSFVDKIFFRTLELIQKKIKNSLIKKRLETEFDSKIDINDLDACIYKFSENLLVRLNNYVEEKNNCINPITIIWIYTNICNLHCIHCARNCICYNDFELNLNEAKKVVDEFNEMGIFELRFSGGEPLLRLDNLLEIGKYANNLGFKLKIETNGLLASKVNSKRLYNAGFKYAQVSIEGSQRIHDIIRGRYTYEKAVEGINNLIDQKISVIIATTISNCNKEEIDNIIQIALKFGVTGIKFTRYMPIGKGLKNIDMFHISSTDEEKIKYTLLQAQDDYNKYLKITFNSFSENWECPAGRFLSCLMPTGEVTVCPTMGDLGINEGNIRSKKFRKLWSYGKLFNNIRDNGYISCSSCKGVSKKNINMFYQSYNKLLTIKDISNLTYLNN